MNIPTFDDLIKRTNEENRESLLDSIAFNRYELKNYRILYHKHSFDEQSHVYNSIIITLKLEFKRLKDEYEQRYGERPDLKDAWGIFNRNRRNVKQSGGESGTLGNIYTDFKLEDMGI